MSLNFTINGIFDIPNQAYTARVSAVETPEGENITTHFLNFCQQHSLSLTTEDEIRTAAFAYAKQFYS